MTPHRKHLVITGLAEEHLQSFVDWADALELTRDQMLVALMVNAGLLEAGLEAFLPDQDVHEEWCELLINRMFRVAHA